MAPRSQTEDETAAKKMKRVSSESSFVSMPDDDGVDQALLAELKRRASALHSGKVKGL